jgi:hypothetical protein
MVINQQQYSQDFKEKLRTVISKQKAIEKKVTQLVLKTYQDFERKYLSKNPEGTQGSWDKETNISDKIWKNEYYKLDNLTHEDSDLLERYRDQLLAKEIIKALGIRVSELRPNMRIGALSLATTKAYITHKNPLNRPYNQRLITNNNERLRPEHSISALIRHFLWPIYYRKNKSSLKLPYERKIVPANVNRDVVTLNNFKNGDKVIGFGNPKYHRYLSQNSFKNLAKMTPTEAFYLSKNWNNRVPLFRDPFNRTKTVYRHDLKFVTLNMNPRYNKAAVKIQSRYKGGKYRNTQIKIANAAEKKSVAANRAAQIAREKFNQAKKVRDVITKRRKKSPSKNNNSPSKRRTLRANAATARATASKRRSP